MKRRTFIAGLGSAAAWPLAVWPRMAWAQQANKLPRVAVLNSAAETDPEAQAWVKAFVQGSAALGWSDGVNVRIDVRWAGGEAKQIEKLAKELVELHPDVVLAISTPSVDAIVRESRTLPIVFTAVTDPVAQGLVETLARPGRNITGFTIFEPEIGSKWLEVVKPIAPETKRAAVIFNPETEPYITGCI